MARHPEAVPHLGWGYSYHSLSFRMALRSLSIVGTTHFFPAGIGKFQAVIPSQRAWGGGCLRCGS
jgi:hypothetical protein